MLCRPPGDFYTATMTNNPYAIGTDIGGSHVCSAVVDLRTGRIAGQAVTTPVDSGASASEILDRWAANLRQAVAASGIASVGRAGLAFPGPFDYARGVSLIAGVRKFDRLFGLDVAASLRSRLCEAGIEEFRFVNDASAFALGECLAGAARDAERVVALTLGTGVGSGFVASRRLVEAGGEVPANGWVYCLPFEGGIADDAFSTRWICRRWQQLSGEEVDGAREVASRCDTDPLSRQLFDEYGDRLAAFAGPLLERFGSRTLLLGGNISRACALFGPAMERRFAAEGRDVDIRSSTLLDRAAMIGAASLYL